MAGCWSTWQVAGRHSRSLVKMVPGQHGRQHPMTLSDSCRQQLALKSTLASCTMNLSSLSGSLSRLLNFGVTFSTSCITLPACAKAVRQASGSCAHTAHTHTHTHTRTCTRTHTNILHDTVTPPCAAWNIQACKSQAERTQCATRHPAITCHLLSTNT